MCVSRAANGSMDIKAGPSSQIYGWTQLKELNFQLTHPRNMICRARRSILLLVSAHV